MLRQKSILATDSTVFDRVSGDENSPVIRLTWRLVRKGPGPLSQTGCGTSRCDGRNWDLNMRRREKSQAAVCVENDRTRRKGASEACWEVFGPQSFRVCF